MSELQRTEVIFPVRAWQSPVVLAAPLLALILGASWYFLVGRMGWATLAAADQNAIATPSVTVIVVSAIVGSFSVIAILAAATFALSVEWRLNAYEDYIAREDAGMARYLARQTAAKLAYEANMKEDAASRYSAAAELFDQAMRAASGGHRAEADGILGAISEQFAGSPDNRLKELAQRAQAARDNLRQTERFLTPG